VASPKSSRRCRVAPLHDFGPTVMAIATQSDVSLRATWRANMEHQKPPPDMASHLRDLWASACPQQHGDACLLPCRQTWDRHEQPFRRDDIQMIIG